jgi:hypothetical protein
MAIVSSIPNNFTSDVVRNIFIRVQFDTPLDRSTITKYTVILIESESQDPVDGNVDYILGTMTVTFQLFGYLKANTDYTLLLIGGTSGIKTLSPNVPFSSANYSVSFKTGVTIDPALALATNATYDDGPAFQGEAGIYKETFDRTGDTVSHIVTTSAQVGPSGTIIPAPWGAERYLPSSGTVPDVDEFLLESSVPSNGEVDVIGDDIVLTFNSNIQSVGSVSIQVVDFLQQERVDENNIDNYTCAISGDTYTITPKDPLTDGLTSSAIYTITLTDVVSTHGLSIDTVTIEFRTKIVPFYSTVRLIRNLGPLVAAESDESITLLIYENSLWIYQTTQTFEIDAPPRAANDYVACKTKLDLIYNRYLVGGQVEQKTLVDLTIRYGPAMSSIVGKKIAELESCVNNNLVALGATGKFIAPQSAVKSTNDSRFPISESGWKRLNNKDFT